MIQSNKALIPFLVQVSASASTTASVVELDLTPFIPERFWKTPFSGLTNQGILSTIHGIGIGIGNISGAATLYHGIAFNTDGTLVTPVIPGAISLNVGSSTSGSTFNNQYPVTGLLLCDANRKCYLRLQTNAGTLDVNTVYGCLELHGS